MFNMVMLQIKIEEENYYALLKIKGTKRSWAKFLKEEILGKNKK